MKHIDVPMFVVLVRYTQPADVVLQHLVAHRAFIERQYASNVFIASGRGAGDDPGVFIATGLTRRDLQELIKGDAFYQHALADYEIVEFHASRVCDALGAMFPAQSPA